MERRQSDPRGVSAAPGEKTRVWPRCSSSSSNSTALFTCTCSSTGEYVHALGDKPQPCARSNSFLKPDLVADSFTDLFDDLPRDLPGGHSCRYPTRLEDHQFTARHPE